jgi:hypothetical protein
LPSTSTATRVARFFFIQIYQNIPNDYKLFQIAIKYTKWSKNIKNCRFIYQHFPFQGPPIYTQIGIFGIKINHLATLVAHPCPAEIGIRQSLVRRRSSLPSKTTANILQKKINKIPIEKDEKIWHSSEVF